MIEFLTIHEVATSKLAFFYHLLADTFFHPSGRPDNFCLRFSRAIADEWLEFIDWSYVASSTTEKTKGSLVKRSRSLLYENAASAESRLDKQGCQTDVSCRPFFRPLWERAWQILCPLNHADRSPFDSRNLNAVWRSCPRKYGSDSEIELYFWGGSFASAQSHARAKVLKETAWQSDMTNLGQYFPVFR